VSQFVLYVEGPSDCDILRSWARLVSAPLSRAVSKSAVILGGRRPARAVEHFRGLAASGQQAANGCIRGVCILDRDGHAGDEADESPEGLEFFTWPRRHIESYLLVPPAMRHCMRMSPGDPRLNEVLSDLPRSSAEGALQDLDAKRLLAGKSTLARELGVPLSPARIARCMHRSDLHSDILDLLDRLGAAAALTLRT
jgi:hypothetical protein